MKRVFLWVVIIITVSSIVVFLFGSEYKNVIPAVIGLYIAWNFEQGRNNNIKKGTS